MNFTPRQIAYGSWITLTLVLFLLGLIVRNTLSDEFAEELKHSEQISHRELLALSAVLTIELQGGRYQNLEAVLDSWGERSDSIAGMQLLAANGFELANYQKTVPVEHSVTQAVAITYSYRGAATLHLHTNLDPVYRHHQVLVTEISLIFGAGALLFSFLVYFALERFNEARLLRQRTQELNAAQQSLTESETKFRTLTVYSPVGIFMDDAEGKAIYINDRCAELVGVPADQALKLDWVPLIHPEDRERVVEEWMKSVRGGQTFNQEYRWVHADGQVVWTRGEIRPVFGEGGAVKVFIGTLIDITELKNAEVERRRLIDELTASNVEMEKFAYTISHDLKAPLITITGFAKLLDKDMARQDRARVADSIAEIRKASEGMTQLIDDLLTLSRTGQSLGVSEEVDLEELMTDIQTRFASQIDQLQARVRLTVPLPRLYMNRARAGQVFQNLFGNALKFHRPGVAPVIEVGVEKRSTRTRVYVRDNGIGIAKPYQTRVFSLFERLDTTREGTGAGLAIARHIVEQHGGRLWVESEVGQGSTFWIELPSSILISHIPKSA